MEQNSAQGGAAKFNVSSFSLRRERLVMRDSLRSIAMHSTVYQKALRDDLIQFVPNSQGLLIKTYRGLAVTVDDGLSVSNGVYMTSLFGAGAIGYAVTVLREAPGNELRRIAAAANDAGQDTLRSRINPGAAPNWLPVARYCRRERVAFRQRTRKRSELDSRGGAQGRAAGLPYDQESIRIPSPRDRGVSIIADEQNEIAPSRSSHHTHGMR